MSNIPSAVEIWKKDYKFRVDTVCVWGGYCGEYKTAYLSHFKSQSIESGTIAKLSKSFTPKGEVSCLIDPWQRPEKGQTSNLAILCQISGFDRAAEQPGSSSNA